MDTIEIFNAVGTSDLHPADGSDNWMDYWCDHANVIQQAKLSSYKCPLCKKSTTDLVGAHVKIEGDNSGTMYIVPLCRSCNNDHSTSFEVDRSMLVPTDEQEPQSSEDVE